MASCFMEKKIPFLKKILFKRFSSLALKIIDRDHISIHPKKTVLLLSNISRVARGMGHYPFGHEKKMYYK